MNNAIKKLYYIFASLFICIYSFYPFITPINAFDSAYYRNALVSYLLGLYGYSLNALEDGIMQVSDTVVGFITVLETFDETLATRLNELEDSRIVLSDLDMQNINKAVKKYFSDSNNQTVFQNTATYDIFNKQGTIVAQDMKFLLIPCIVNTDGSTSSYSYARCGLMFITDSSNNWKYILVNNTQKQIGGYYGINYQNEYYGLDVINYPLVKDIMTQSEFNSYLSSVVYGSSYNDCLSKLTLSLDPPIGGNDDTYTKAPQLDGLDLNLKNYLNPTTDTVIDLGALDSYGGIDSIFKDIVKNQDWTWSKVNDLIDVIPTVKVDDVSKEVTYTDTETIQIGNNSSTDINTNYKNLPLSTVFPFCIPFDLSALIKKMQSIQPISLDNSFSLHVPWWGSNGFYSVLVPINLGRLDKLLSVIRSITLVLYILFLILITRIVIRS